jgi:hypothetical protein
LLTRFYQQRLLLVIANDDDLQQLMPLGFGD